MNLSQIGFWFLGLVWGINFLFMKISIEVIPPEQVVWLRVLFGGAPIILFGLYRKALKISDLKMAHHFVALAVISIIIPYMGLLKASQYLQSGVAGAMSGLIPILTAFFVSILLPSESLSKNKIIGLVLGFFGVALISQIDKILANTGNSSLQGVGLMLLACTGYGLGMVYAKKFIVPLGLSSLALACYQNFFAAVILTLIVPWSGAEAVFTDLKVFAALAIGLGLLGTGLAFIIYFFIIEKMGALSASSVFYIPPIVALMAGAIFRNEWLTFTQVLGAIIILAGVYLARNDTKTKVIA